jgi:hypothetical protein
VLKCGEEGWFFDSKGRAAEFDRPYIRHQGQVQFTVFVDPLLWTLALPKLPKLPKIAKTKLPELPPELGELPDLIEGRLRRILAVMAILAMP